MHKTTANNQSPATVVRSGDGVRHNKKVPTGATTQQHDVQHCGGNEFVENHEDVIENTVSNNNIRNEVMELVKRSPDWKDITPAERHGKETVRSNDNHSLVQCLIVRNDPVTGEAFVHLEFLKLDELPATERKHELYSICLSKDVYQIIWNQDVNQPEEVSKILYLHDGCMWTQPEVSALVLMMHASMKSDALKSGVRDDNDIKNAEIFAEQYCRSVGVERANLPALHSSGVSTRISRTYVNEVNSQPIVFHGRVPDTPEPVLCRMDSQSPFRAVTPVFTEHGGIESTFVMTPDGHRKELGSTLERGDIYTTPMDTGSEAALTRKQKKAEKKAKKRAEKEARPHKSIKEQLGLKSSKKQSPAAVQKSQAAHHHQSTVSNAVVADGINQQTRVPTTITEDYWTADREMKQSPIMA
eukprot:GHVH01013232.1.p1 GENE.GHVH01013232.1~~GHVH01013232.1.p1  ORF type:complete len:414 (+),score=53.20 GHVH01013232.1:244-1485(+)